MVSFQKYPEYLATKYPWIGDVPSSWEVRRLKEVGRLFGGAGFPHEYQNVQGEELYFYKVGDLSLSENGKTLLASPHTISKDTAQLLRAIIVPKNAIVYAKIGAALLLNRRRMTTAACCIDNNMTAYVVDAEKVVPEWAFYWLSTLDFGEHVNPGAVPSFSEGYQSVLPIPVPPIEEQKVIARFLDFKTAQIDALIAKQQSLLGKLAEKRTALISHAVTKGLDPSVPMQDSEVQWLGDIPAHWKTTRIKFVARVGNGSTPSRDKPDYWVDGYFPWLNSSVVNQEAVTESDQFVTDLALKECHLPIITPPAVLVGITGQGKTRGMASKLSTIATINQHLAYIKPTTNDIRVDYLLFLFERAYSFLRSESDGGGSTKGAITCEQIANLEIPLPPASEQAAIEVYVADELEMLRNMNQRVANVVEKLQEYRSALITNAVTGKIDVRGFRVPHIDAEVAS
nr:restriction endonuclease subunit S [Aeromonas jandaei]